jgi:hypothetical protein
VTEQERDQQPPDAAIAVEERVDGLELRVRHRCVDERRELLVMEERLQVPERFTETMRSWRNERCGRERRVTRADPVLRGAELAGLTLAPAGVLHPLGVDLADEAKRQRQPRAGARGRSSSRAHR